MLHFSITSSGEISLLCLGPLTNLALALRLDPLIATNLRELIIVGGNIEGWHHVLFFRNFNFFFLIFGQESLKIFVMVSSQPGKFDFNIFELRFSPCGFLLLLLLLIYVDKHLTFFFNPFFPYWD